MRNITLIVYASITMHSHCHTPGASQLSITLLTDHFDIRGLPHRPTLSNFGKPATMCYRRENTARWDNLCTNFTSLHWPKKTVVYTWRVTSRRASITLMHESPAAEPSILITCSRDLTGVPFIWTNIHATVLDWLIDCFTAHQGY